VVRIQVKQGNVIERKGEHACIPKTVIALLYLHSSSLRFNFDFYDFFCVQKWGAGFKSLHGPEISSSCLVSKMNECYVIMFVMLLHQNFYFLSQSNLLGFRVYGMSYFVLLIAIM
jgi:hypothetical protein